MDSIKIEDIEYCDLRVDSVLSDMLEIPRNRIQNYIQNGYITIYNDKKKKIRRLKINGVIFIDIPKEPELTVLPENADINIVYEDESIVVVDKPANLVVHPGAAKETQSVVSALLFRGVKLSGIGAPLRPGVVHRIDKDTSGVIVLAKTDRAHFVLAKQFFSHTIDRKYIGLVLGHLKKQKGIVDAPIARHPTKRKEFCVKENGKSSKTAYKVIKRLKDIDVVLFKLFSGRTHQIRVHMKYLNHPLVGDGVYGTKKTKTIKRQALHAFFLSFTHPETLKRISFYSKLPEDILMLIKNGG